MADRPMPVPPAPEPVADDVTPPESGEMTTIYARMAREDEAWQAKALMKAFRNSHTFCTC